MGGVRARIREFAKHKLEVNTKYVVIWIGQFIHRKGPDIMIRTAASLGNDYTIYMIGGQPTSEMMNMKDRLGAKNLKFVDFQKKEQLQHFYQAADCFAFTTREDIWGLVINEAMSYGLPVVSSNRSIAALEMITNDKEGYVIESENCEHFKTAIEKAAESNIYLEPVNTVNKYSIESMTHSHKVIFKL